MSKTHPHHSAPRSITRRIARRALGAVFVFALLLALVLSAAPASAQTTLAETRVELSASATRVDQLISQRSDLEQTYRQHVARVEQLKKRHDNGDLVGDSELRKALAEARAVAESLNTLSTSLREAQKAEGEARSSLIVSLSAEIQQHERRLTDSPPDALPQIIATLDALQRERGQLNAAANPLPPEPSPLPKLDGLDLDDPDALLAAAGELSDHERTLKDQLSTIESRLDALERRRRARMLADDTRDENRLFAEDQIPIQVAARQPGKNNTDTAEESTGTPRGVNQSSNSGAETTSGTADNEQRSDDPQVLGGGEPSTSPPSNDSDGDGATSLTESGDDFGSPTPVFTESPGTVDPSTGNPVIIVDSTPQIGIIRSDADPNAILRVGDDDRDDSNADNELKLLKQRQLQLRRSLNALDTQKQTLQGRASDLGVDLDLAP